MDNVTDISEAGRDAAVLTDAGSGGLIGRAVLADRPLVDHLADDETPRFVLRNKKHGVTVAGPDGSEEFAPDRSHSGAAVLTDVRVLFAVGRSDGDRTVSVALADVVDVRTEDGLLGGAFVVETVGDERYRFPCRGDLAPAREFLDAAVGVWTRAQRHVDEAREQVERLRSAFESGDVDVVLAAVGDVEATLTEAREAAEPLEGARTRVGDRADAVRAELAGIERRARAEYAEQARERAHVRWDDGDYETALDDLEDADAAYAAAMESAGEEPSDGLLSERRNTLADERDRLAAAPVDRAEHAADVASATDDPGAAVDWWGTAVERYDTALSLDWGRDERRFAGDPDGLRDDLAEAARELVAAYCKLAREHVADGDEDRDANPEAAAAAYDLAADALAEAREVARERVPGRTDEIDRVEATLEERCETLSECTQSTGTGVDGGVGNATSSGSNDDEHENPSDDAETDGTRDDAVPVDSPDPDPVGDSETSAGTDAGRTGPGETPSDVAPETDGAVEAMACDSGDGETTGADEEAPGAASEPTAREQRTAETDAGRFETADPDADGTDPVEQATGEPESTGADPDESGADADGSGDSEARPESDSVEYSKTVITRGGTAGPAEVRSGSESESGPGSGSDSGSDPGEVTDPAAVDPAAFPSLVARVFEAAGWSTTVFGATTDGYDLVAATDGPVGVTLCVWTVHPAEVERVDASTVDRYAAAADDTGAGDLAAVCSAAPVAEAARTRADERGLKLLGPADLRDSLADLSVPAEEF